MTHKSIYDFKVSVFYTIKDSNNPSKMKTMTLSDALLLGHKYIPEITHARQFSGKETPEIKAMYDAQKQKLPAFTISCLCGQGTKDIVQEHPVICIDIDMQDNPGLDPEKAKNDLIELPNVFYASISIGGKGVFALVLLSGTNRFKERFNALEQYILNKTGYKIDSSCSNPNRLRCISFDDDPVFKIDNIVPFPALKADSAPMFTQLIQGVPKGNHLNEDLLNDDKFCTAVADYCINHLGIKTGDYADWLSHMGALSTLEMEGEALAQQLSVQSPGYKDADDVRKTLRSTKGKGNHRQYLLRYFKECKDALGHDWIKIIKAQYNCFNAA